MHKNWDDVKERIYSLYKLQRKPLQDVVKLMSLHYGFNASLRAYKDKVKEWGYTKYTPHRRPVNRSNSQQHQPQSSETGDERDRPLSNGLHALSGIANDTSSFGLFQNHATPLPLSYGSPGVWTFSASENHYSGFNDVGYSLRSPTGVSHFGNSALLDSERNSMASKDGNGQTSLHHAVINGSVKEVERLLSSGAAVDIADCDGDQPLHHAAAGAFPEIIRLLLKYGADVDAKGRDGMTPLHMSVRSPSTVKALLKSHPVVSSQDNNGDTPLRLAMVTSAFNDLPKGSIIGKLIEYGANVNTHNLKQITPFHMALESSRSVGKHHASWVVMFLENKADILLRNRDGLLPFEIYLQYTNRGGIKFSSNNKPLNTPAQSFKLFVDKGADLNVVLESGEPLINDVLNGVCHYPRRDLSLAHLLCETADVTKVGASGDFPLHCAFHRWSGYSTIQRKLVNAILDRGADPNQTNQVGKSPLILLLSNKGNNSNFSDVEIVEVLLARGADPMLTDASGTLPVYLAIRNYKDEAKEKLVKLLLKAIVSDKMTNQSRLSGASDQIDQPWWNSYRLFYRQISWSSPAHLAESSYLIPADVADELSKIALSLLAEKFLQSLKVRAETAHEGGSLVGWSRKSKLDQLVDILRDCRSLKIDVDISWYHLLLDLRE